VGELAKGRFGNERLPATPTTQRVHPLSTRILFSTIFLMALLSAFVMRANAQVAEQAAREQASNIVRSELHSRVNFKSDQFLNIRRDDDLEQSLAIATVGWRVGPVFIYKISPTGVEIRENSIVNHVATDAEFMYVVAVSSADGSIYRIHGFGQAQSLADFQRLMTAQKMRVGPDQAEALADFYRKVNPENYEAVTPISSLMELKQAAERQCQSGAKSFGDGEKAFTAWWKQAEPLYAALPFQQKAVPHGSGYLVEWIVLSSPSGESCGGAPLRAQLEIGSDGRVGKVTFPPLQKGRGVQR
jgi:hypothetical protein